MTVASPFESVPQRNASFPSRALSRWQDLPFQARATSLLLLFLIAGGVVLRIQGVGFPPRFTFDEELFVKNAQNYLVGMPDQNDHPPLGKLLMAVGMLAFGYNSVGWRFVSLCFGIQTIVIAYCLARELFQNRRAALFAAAFIAGDGFFIAYSRVGLLDGMLTCLVLWSMLAAISARSVAGVFVSAVLVGIATSIKWSGALTVIPAAVAVLALGRAPRLSVACFAVAPLVHLGIWSLGLRLVGEPNDPLSLFRVMSGLYRHHLEMGYRTNPLASPWHTWIGLYHPIVVKASASGFKNYYASSVGNPVLWFAASLAVILVPLGALVAKFSDTVQFHMRRLLDPLIAARAPLLSLGWLALLSPWMVARGKYTFMYHYLPCYAFALVLLAGSVANLERRWPSRIFWAMALVVGVAIHFAPVWGELPLTELAAHRRLIFPLWRP